MIGPRSGADNSYIAPSLSSGKELLSRARVTTYMLVRAGLSEAGASVMPAGRFIPIAVTSIDWISSPALETSMICLAFRSARKRVSRTGL